MILSIAAPSLLVRSPLIEFVTILLFQSLINFSSGDNNVLVKYLNPHVLVICTAYETQSSSGDLTDAKMFINVIDSVSGKMLTRVPHENAVGPFNSLVLENFIFVSYWNPKVRHFAHANKWKNIYYLCCIFDRQNAVNCLF